MNEDNIQLTAFQDEDLALFAHWIEKDYIYKWFCCDGKEDKQSRIDGLEEKQAWLAEVENRAEHAHRHLFIVSCDGRKIGFGVFIDLTGEPEYTEAQYPDLVEKISAHEALELGYCIGEEAYLNKGIGKIIIKKLEAECCKLDAKLLLADPSEQNIPSVKVLVANGFERYKDGDYRKWLMK
ncbi:MAG: GNAT family N-acetyltransferase [Oscillospiraceae bacterium]|nr:GNAT family N-acetyltransferase [Oscillospiraceae bacterium]